jgi:hypothetical protein
VTRTEQLEHGEHRYVGGVTYTIIDSDVDELASFLDDVQNWRGFLPRTRDVRLVANEGAESLVEITHGSGLLKVAYTLQVLRDGNLVRFWVDRGRPHDIEDAWGFFRAEPLPRGQTLLTYGVLIDIGPGLLRDLFENRVYELALAVPDNVRTAALQASARGRRASR